MPKTRGGKAYLANQLKQVSRLTMRETLELVRDCSSQEWQQPDGKRMAATDNQGRRMWFITEDIMQEVRSSIGDPERSEKDAGGGEGISAAWSPGPLESVKNCLDNSLKRAIYLLQKTKHEGDAIDAKRLEYLRELVKLGVPHGGVMGGEGQQ